MNNMLNLSPSIFEESEVHIQANCIFECKRDTSQEYQVYMNKNQTIFLLLAGTLTAQFIAQEMVLRIQYNFYTFINNQQVQEQIISADYLKLQFFNTSNDIIFLDSGKLSQFGLTNNNQWECQQVIAQKGVVDGSIFISESDDLIIVSNSYYIQSWKRKEYQWIQMQDIYACFYNCNYNQYISCLQGKAHKFLQLQQSKWKQICAIFPRGQIVLMTANFIVIRKKNTLIFHWNIQQKKIISKQTFERLSCADLIRWFPQKNLLTILDNNTMEIVMLQKNDKNQFISRKKVAITQADDIRDIQISENGMFLGIVVKSKIYSLRII